jgi:anthranilate phosphoribosyltransferase
VIEATLGRVVAGEDLSMDEMSAAIEAIMQGQCGEGEIATLLTGLRAKGETVEEVAGAAAAMRKFMTPIRSDRDDLIDTCGTGGDGSGTFNISTAAAVVTAAAGQPVAKHGNRAITSKTGSADVLAALGVNVEADVPCVERCLEELGICFCFAPLMHQSMKHVGPVRRKLGVPTIFNMLGPLTNPAAAPFQLLGVGRPELRELLAEALAMLGTRRALVVCGEDGIDEVSLAGVTHVSEATDGAVRSFTWTPEEFGLEPTGSESMLVDDADASAAMIRDIFAGSSGPPRDIVVLNAAAALWTAGRDESPSRCAQFAVEAIDSGAARDLLAKLAELSNA